MNKPIHAFCSIIIVTFMFQNALALTVTNESSGAVTVKVCREKLCSTWLPLTKKQSLKYDFPRKISLISPGSLGPLVLSGCPDTITYTLGGMLVASGSEDCSEVRIKNDSSEIALITLRGEPTSPIDSLTMSFKLLPHSRQMLDIGEDYTVAIKNEILDKPIPHSVDSESIVTIFSVSDVKILPGNKN